MLSSSVEQVWKIKPRGAEDQKRQARPVATLADLEAAEQRLRFRFPAELRQVYLEVADGGVGPGNGILGAQASAALYDELLTESPSRGGQPWPADRLPLKAWDVGLDCLSIATGTVVAWDEEELAENASDAVWQRSFKPTNKTLGDWLATPSAAEMRRAALATPADVLTEQTAILEMSDEDFEKYLADFESDLADDQTD